MPEMQPTSTASAPQPIVMEIPVLDDPDYALGCECAYPALQIEPWMQEVSTVAS